MWDSGIARYRFDPETATTSDEAPLWALPKDIGPTVLYYNAKYLKDLNITEISVPEAELADFNASNGTSYLAKGYTLEWIEARIKAIINRKKCDYSHLRSNTQF